MSDEKAVERAKAIEDLQHALVVDDVELRLDAMRRLGHDHELTDIEKVDGLRHLIIVELASAMTMDAEYASARAASYVFVLEAIERRWPQFSDWTDIRDQLLTRMKR